MDAAPVLTLQPKQSLAFTTRATEVLFGGAAGAGKSHLLRVVAIAWCCMIPGLKVGLFRRLYPDLKANHLEGPGSFYVLLAGYIASGHVRIIHGEIIFWNGSRINLHHCQRETDVIKYQGAEFHVLLFDELTHFTQYQYRYIRGRLRTSKDLHIPAHLRQCFPRIMSGSNPGGIGHCVRFGEVWTETGWRDIWDVKQGERAFSREADGSIGLRVVEQIHRHTAERLLRYEVRGLTIEATPEHKVGVMRGDALHLTPLADLPGQAYIARSAKWDGGKGIGSITVPFCQTGRKSKVTQPLTVTGEQYAALAAWTVTEGSVGRYSGEWRWSIAQSKKAQRATIIALLDSCGFDYQSTDTGFTIPSESWVKHWTDAKCRFKRVPPLIMQRANHREITAFITAAVDGDGHWTKRGESGQFYTTSPGLADDFQALACKAGFATHLAHREREERLGQSYCVSFKSHDRTELLTGNHRYKVATKTARAKSAEIIEGRFPVACIGVEGTHNFFIRQNGSVWISGNSWVKETFVEPGEMRIHRASKKEGGMKRQYIPGRLTDNPALLESDPEYIDRLSGLGDPVLVRALMDGDWDVAAGAMFGDVWRKDRHTCDSFPIPVDWTIWMGADDGYAAPASVHWLTQDPVNKTIYVIAELTEAKMLPETMAAKIKRISAAILRRHNQHRVEPHGADEGFQGLMDSAAYADTGTGGIPRGNQLKALGIRFKPVEKWVGSPIHRAQNLSRLLAPNPLDPEGRPGIIFFKTCSSAIKTIPTLPRDKNNIEQADTNGDDHDYDSVTYGVQYKISRKGSMRAGT